ncbi:MAG: glutathione S-transferase family protein [Pseudomonadota bacterium]
MPELDPKDPTLKTLSGLHLWHAPMSSCSQRVRIVLAELDRGYESHLVDLAKDEHASEAYQRIHPNGLVPALVEDGRLFIESIDIIRHLAADQPELGAASDNELLTMADEAQKDLKLLSFEFLFRSRPAPEKAEADAFQNAHKNDWLKQFRTDFATGFPPERINDAIRRTDEGFQTLNERLSDGCDFLSGADFTISDVAWMPNVHRMRLMDWPFEHLAQLERWFARVSERASYSLGLMDWQGGGVAGSFADYTAQRRGAGTGVRSFPHFSKTSVSS